MPARFSDWATPIVPILKENENIRLFWDFKVTSNPYLEIDRHTLSRIEDLLISIQRGIQLTKFDPHLAHNQMPLSPESRKFEIINSHLGLFQFTRLSFGVADGPVSFQRIFENYWRVLMKWVRLNTISPLQEKMKKDIQKM